MNGLYCFFVLFVVLSTFIQLSSIAFCCNMDSENSIQMSRPKFHKRLNLDSSQKLPQTGLRNSGGDLAAMSPMTNLVHNLSGATLDSTPKRRTYSLGNFKFFFCWVLLDHKTTTKQEVFSAGGSLFQTPSYPLVCVPSCGKPCGLDWQRKTTVVSVLLVTLFSWFFCVYV